MITSLGKDTKLSVGSCYADGHDALTELNHDYPVVVLQVWHSGIRLCEKHYPQFLAELAALPKWEDVQ